MSLGRLRSWWCAAATVAVTALAAAPAFAQIPIGRPGVRPPGMTLIGARINGVVANSAAAQAGLLPGDAIIEINGVPITSMTALTSAVRSSRGQAELLVRDVHSGRLFLQFAAPTTGVLGVYVAIVPVVVYHVPFLAQPQAGGPGLGGASGAPGRMAPATGTQIDKKSLPTSRPGAAPGAAPGPQPRAATPPEPGKPQPPPPGTTPTPPQGSPPAPRPGTPPTPPSPPDKPPMPGAG
jgi:membrane-associated protease RseP (regulator of RpoE activity)